MNEYFNSHYIRVDTNSNVMHGFSDAFEQPQPSDILINAEGGRHFRLVPEGTDNPPLHNLNGVPLYRWDGEQVVARSVDEIKVYTPSRVEPLLTIENRVQTLEKSMRELVKAVYPTAGNQAATLQRIMSNT